MGSTEKKSIYYCPVCGGTDCVRSHEPSRAQRVGIKVLGRKVCPVCRKLRRLVHLNDKGVKICAKCFGRPKFRSYGVCSFCKRKDVEIALVRADGKRVCIRCYHAPLEKCVLCGRQETVGMRTEEGSICGRCYKKSHPRVIEKCVRCGRKRVVQQRTAKGPICSTCYQKTYKPPKRICARCGKEGNAYKRTPEGTICARCYRTPSEVCVRCRNKRPVKCRTDQGPLCSRCYQRGYAHPKRVCILCRKRKPVGKRTAKGPICIRCYRPPARVCVRCGRKRPTVYRSSEGPVCKTCYERARALAKKKAGTSPPQAGKTPNAPPDFAGSDRP